MASKLDVFVWVISLLMLVMVFAFAYLGYKGGYPHRYAMESFAVDLLLFIAFIYGTYQLFFRRTLRGVSRRG